MMKKQISWFVALFWLWMSISTAVADTTYIVQPGDTLYSIARRFGVTVTAVVQANHILNPNLIYPGSTLIIPGSTTPPTTPPTIPQTTNSYVVQPSDTLFRIALRYGVSVPAIVQANGLINPSLIFVGQTLLIPGGSPPSAPPSNPIPPPANPMPTGANLLLNPSFEGGWYHQNGTPELQLPESWQFAWDVGTNPFDSNPWSNFVRPETRVLSTNFLPPHEHSLFIWDGQQTVKIFKGSGAISFRLTQDLILPPGSYQLELNLFPDLVASYENGQKVWAALGAGEVQLLGGGGGSPWQTPVVGQKNRLTYSFTISQAQTVRVGAAIRGRYALANNGWFMDDWSLRRIGN